MLSTTSDAARPARLTSLWFGVQIVWGAVLGISLQARCAQLAGANALAVFGGIAASGAAMAAVVQLLAGPLSDRLRRGGDDRSGFYLAGTIVGGAAIIAFYFVSNVTGLFVAFLALQVGLNVVIGAYQAIVPDAVVPSRFGTASAWLAAMGSGGNALGAIFAALAGRWPGAGIVLAFALTTSAAITIAHVRSIALQPLRASVHLKFSRTLVNLFISRALVYLGFYTTLGYLYFFVASVLPAGAPIDATRASGLFILLFTAVGTIGAVLAGKPADRLDERLVVTVGGSVAALSLGALGAWGSPATFGGLPVAITVAGLGWGIFLCADWALACRLLPRAMMAGTMAIWNLAVVGPQVLAPIAATAFLARFGLLGNPSSPRFVLLLAGVEMLVGAAWIWRLPRGETGKMGYGPDCMEPGEAGHAL